MAHATQEHIESIWARTFDQVLALNAGDIAKATEAADSAVAAFKRATRADAVTPAAESASAGKPKK